MSNLFDFKFLENFSVRSFVFGFLVAVFLFAGFSIPFLIRDSIDFDGNSNIRIVEKGNSEIRIHTEDSHKEFVIFYLGNSKFRIQEIGGEFSVKYGK